MQPSEVYAMSARSEPSVQQKPKLLDRVRAAIRSHHYRARTEETYIACIRRCILSHGKRHQAELGGDGPTCVLSVPSKPSSCRAFRHSSTTRHLADGYPSAVRPAYVLRADRKTAHPSRMRTAQELLGHTDVSTAMIYTHVLNRGGRGVRSPADRLLGVDRQCRV